MPVPVELWIPDQDWLESIEMTVGQTERPEAADVSELKGISHSSSSNSKASPVVCRDRFLEVMEVALRGLVVVCFLWERVVVKAASG